MGAKRKRPASNNSDSRKRAKVACKTNAATVEDRGQVDHPVLRHYFDRATTLREHLIADLSERSLNGQHTTSDANTQAIFRITNEQDSPVGEVLDSVIVGHRFNAEKTALRERRAKDIVSFTQQLPSSTIGSNSSDFNHAAQLEVVDFVIWLLFRRSQAPSRPQHLLTQGFDRLAAKCHHDLERAVPGIPGIVCKFSNPHTSYVMSKAWCTLLSLLGKGGDIVMVDLLLESCLFLPNGDSTRSLRQFSGTPLSSLQPCINQTTSDKTQASKNGGLQKSQMLPRQPSKIKFVRNRMFFAQPSVSASNKIKFGLHSIHVLNRYSNVESNDETIHILKHVFPRQFRLHNAFTSPVDPRESALPFKDYTLRESEIKRLLLTADGAIDSTKQARVPKRLAGEVLHLVSRLRKLHRRCTYTQLLQHYCALPDETMEFLTTKHMPRNITDLATPASRVSAFCQAVIKRIIPNSFWGNGDAGLHNKHVTLKNIDNFLRARKFESFTLSSFLLNLKVATMSWLRLPQQKGSDHMSATDFVKRKELLAEFLYWLIDSLLIPLVRSNFHVTESNVHRNRLFYFRHDVWQALCEPALETFKTELFEELNGKAAKKRLEGRTFGYSTVRLLPKVNSFRPITNLRRRPYVWVNGRKQLGKSINSALNPAFRALNHEKSTHLDELGCSLFSVSDIYPKLKEFQARLQTSGNAPRPLYFAKVDVQACFDTIPQQAVLRVVKDLLNAEEYLVQGEAHVKPPEPVTLQKGAQSVRPVVKFTSTAKPMDHKVVNRGQAHVPNAVGNAILVTPLGQQTYGQSHISSMLTEHVEFNLIKIGKKFYRQKNGIPQGSVLSSLLCNFFYGKLEKHELSFLQGRADTLLLRLIDDFLLITAEKGLAERFLRVMHAGLPEYGIEVKPAKSLVNFGCVVNGHTVLRAEADGFPYCGLSIDMVRLDISKSGQVRAGTAVADSLTVEYSNVPGRTFRRKALNALKIQLHSMYFDTSFNDLTTALANLYRLFHDAAQRLESYMRTMPKHSAPSFETVKGTIEDLIQLAYTMVIKRKKTRTIRAGGNVSDEGSNAYVCAIRKNQAVYVACQAFIDVFAPRQTKHGDLLAWLRRKVAVFIA